MTWFGRVAVLATAVLAYKNRNKLAAWMQGGEHARRGGTGHDVRRSPGRGAAEVEDDRSGMFRGVGASAAARNRAGQPSGATADSRFSGGAPQA